MLDSPGDPPPAEGGGDAEQAPNPDDSSPAYIYTLSLTREPIDYIIEGLGYVPNEPLRLSIAQELNDSAPYWINSVIEAVTQKVAGMN